MSESDPYVEPLERIFDIDKLAKETGWCIILKTDPVLSNPALTQNTITNMPSGPYGPADIVNQHAKVDILTITSFHALFVYFYNTPDNVRKSCF